MSYRAESRRLQSAVYAIKKYAPHFGVNKQRESVRLLYEISKRECVPVGRISRKMASWDYDVVKTYLLRRRFPLASAESVLLHAYLPRVHIDRGNLSARIDDEFYPQQVIVEEKASGSSLEARFRSYYPRACVRQIDSLKSYMRAASRYSIEDYNNRRNTIFLVAQQYDFLKRCPCTAGAVGCGYHIVNQVFGCIYECSYCFLQEYSNVPGIVLTADTSDCYAALSRYLKPGMRVGSGEFTDSLMLDHVTGYSEQLISFFRAHPHCTFEFKTKSDNIERLLSLKHAGNIVVSWSVNPQALINSNEFLSSNLLQRLAAAKRVADAGYKIGFHFDPVIYCDGWQRLYAELIEQVCDAVPVHNLAWVSVGTFRFTPELKPIIEQRFPDNTILDAELLPGFDGKLRYPDYMRLMMFQYVIERLRKRIKRPIIYLCMESAQMWRALNLKSIVQENFYAQ